MILKTGVQRCVLIIPVLTVDTCYTSFLDLRISHLNQIIMLYGNYQACTGSLEHSLFTNMIRVPCRISNLMSGSAYLFVAKLTYYISA